MLSNSYNNKSHNFDSIHSKKTEKDKLKVDSPNNSCDFKIAQLSN